VITSNELRKIFLDYFKEREHEIVDSSGVIPFDDPSLLFTNAGMNQFKNVFLGLEKRSYKRAASVQKCIRASGKHNDLEDVGKDGRHHTFFEMLGNWSFGDYYKREAISWAWELVTKRMNLPEENLWVSIYKDDEEAYNIWLKNLKIDKKRIVRLGDIEKGDEENFWSMAINGPCGPCSEIYYDYYPSEDRDFFTGSETGEIVELWNLVFMEYNKGLNGRLTPLPEKNIDTGMGLERALAVLQGVHSNYETDLFIPIIKKIEEISGKNYKTNAVSFQVIADHIRSLVFAICDGVVPSNEHRGYVLRRILRRAMRHGKLLGLKEPFLYRLINVLIEVMKDQYHELLERRATIENVILNEEELFLKTLDRGVYEFDKTVELLSKNGITVFPGEKAFLLHDTYGFPLDLTQIMASERGMNIDVNGFNNEMLLQKKRAKRESKFKKVEEKDDWIIFRTEEKTLFTGYENIKEEGMYLVKYKQNDKHVFLVFNKTPFYAESGGQVGDRGYINGDGIKLRITDVKKMREFFIHEGEIEKGEIKDIEYTGFVDTENRRKIAANHTATHLLHHALKKIIGQQIAQSGSLVLSDRLRFDYNQYNPLSDKQIELVEDMVNDIILQNLPVNIYNNVPIKEAKKMGATALFKEKYGKLVRVVDISGISIELCGGTHVKRTGDIGLFKIIRESSIASGIRRIEAITNVKSLGLVRKNERVLKETAMLLHTDNDGIIEKIKSMQSEIKEIEKKLKSAKKKKLKEMVDFKKDIVKVGKFNLIFLKPIDLSHDEMREISDSIKSKLKMGAIFIASVKGGKINFVLSLTDDAVKQGAHAGKLLQIISQECNGRGGGKPHLAQGGGNIPKNIDKAFNKLKKLLEDV